MNPYFLPNQIESTIIDMIQMYTRNEFSLIRMTETMLKKSIIDASDMFNQMVRQENVVNYSEIKQGQKVFGKSYIITKDGVLQSKVSYYRPKTKNGDPRFWPYGLTKFVKSKDLIYFFIINKELYIVPLNNNLNISYIQELFPKESSNSFSKLATKIQNISNKWIPSISPFKSNPKDVGDTFEHILGIPINNSRKADYLGEIELKTKRKKSKTLDTLFSKVPNWKISPVTSSTEMILKYGYQSKKHLGFIDLYVTVSNIPNQQQLFLSTDEEMQHLLQEHVEDKIVCRWTYDVLKLTLQEKHPKTIWVMADEKKVDGKIHFKYEKMMLTEKPIFSQFITLIGQGIITFDWRGKVLPNATKYRDHGHCFRIKPKFRYKLFGQTQEITP